eukprot:365987-Chlamydomonas_euryale.AAC.37
MNSCVAVGSAGVSGDAAGGAGVAAGRDTCGVLDPYGMHHWRIDTAMNIPKDAVVGVGATGAFWAGVHLWGGCGCGLRVVESGLVWICDGCGCGLRVVEPGYGS